jgi:uncharacterized membrane protein
MTAGDKVDVKIVNIRPSERRMTLSLRQFEQQRERQQLKEYMQRQEDSSRVTIGDLFGSVLANTQAARRQAEPEAASAPSEAAAEPTEEVESPPAGEQPTEEGPGGGEQEAEEDSASLEGAAQSSSESPAESEAERD